MDWQASEDFYAKVIKEIKEFDVLRAEANDFFFKIEDFEQFQVPQEKSKKKGPFIIYEYEISAYNNKWR